MWGKTNYSNTTCGGALLFQCYLWKHTAEIQTAYHLMLHSDIVKLFSIELNKKSMCMNTVLEHLHAHIKYYNIRFVMLNCKHPNFFRRRNTGKMLIMLSFV